MVVSDDDDNVARVSRYVEWLALLWWKAAPECSRPANPSLASQVAASISPTGDLALGLVRLLQDFYSRDRAIKAVVSVASGVDWHEQEQLHQVIEALCSELGKIDRELCDDREAVLWQAREVAKERIRVMVVGLDPAADLESVTGEVCSLETVLCPSLFLPPPQDGRHGAVVSLGEGKTIAHMYFGLPLDGGLMRYGIDRQFLSTGAWHYALTGILQPLWGEVADAIRPLSEVEHAFEGASGEGGERPWPGVVEAHLRFALRSHLAEEIGAKRKHFRLFAQAFSVLHFDWFADWLDQRRAENCSLSRAIQRLPADLATAAHEGKLKADGGSGPTAINLTLISGDRRGLTAVVPDLWGEELIAAVRAGWRALDVPVIRHGDWCESESSTPTIAFGEPSDNPLVAAVLERRGLQVPQSREQTLLALSAVKSIPCPWTLAISARDPEVAAAVSLEVSVRLTCTFAVLEGEQVISADGITGGT